MTAPSRYGLRPLVEFEREIAALVRDGVTEISVPDVGLYIGESVDEGMRRAVVLSDFARRRGATLFIRNEHHGDVSARALPANEP